MSPDFMKQLLLTLLSLFLLILLTPSVHLRARVYRENFEDTRVPEGEWVIDSPSDRDPFEDNGKYFQGPLFTPPRGFRTTTSFGEEGWLKLESYSREKTDVHTLATIVVDPSDRTNKALKIHSPKHTDGTIIANGIPLTRSYRICLRVGQANFGDGEGLNGYMGNERAEPWGDRSSLTDNGFYWLTILDEIPKPRNNIWIHHHRKVVIDSDSNADDWTHIWNGREFLPSGQLPLMMFALPFEAPIHPRIGKPFISFAAGMWHPVGMIRAVDAYEKNRWYRACIERSKERFTLTTSGKFKYGGYKVYSGTIVAEKVHNHNIRPEYFMFGDPHTNFYRGEVLFDDIELTLLAGE